MSVNEEKQKTQTLKEVAERLNLPETTLRLLREEFDDLIPVVGEGRRRRYLEDGATILGKIVGWRRQGWSGGRIRAELSRDFTPRGTVPRAGREEAMPEITTRLIAQGEEIARLRVEVGALRQAVSQLVDILRREARPTVSELLDES